MYSAAEKSLSSSIPITGITLWLIHLVPGFLGARSFTSSGAFRPLSLLLALIATGCTFEILNIWLIGRIEREFDTATLPEFRTVRDTHRSADRVLELKWADPKIYPWLKEVLHSGSPDYPASRQAVALFNTPGVGSTPPEERLALLKRMMITQKPTWIAGQLPRWALFAKAGLWIDIEPPPTTELFAALAEADDRRWLKAIESPNQSFAEEKKRFAQRYLEAVTARTQEPLRDLRRINGWIQWLSVFLFFLLVISLIRRSIAVGKLRYSARVAAKLLDADPATTFEELPVRPSASEVAALVTRSDTLSAEHRVHELGILGGTIGNGAMAIFGNLLAALPALGFVGTVLGIGDALLRAEGLFSSQDKQNVIALITRDLGFAFDTTLVALGLSLVAGLVYVLVKNQEARVFFQWSIILRADRVVPLKKGHDPANRIPVAQPLREGA